MNRAHFRLQGTLSRAPQNSNLTIQRKYQNIIQKDNKRPLKNRTLGAAASLISTKARPKHSLRQLKANEKRVVVVVVVVVGASEL